MSFLFSPKCQNIVPVLLLSCKSISILNKRKKKSHSEIAKLCDGKQKESDAIKTKLILFFWAKLKVSLIKLQ